MVLEKEKEKMKENEKKNINKEEIKQIQKKTNKIILITFAVVMIIIVSIAGITSIVSNINEKKKQEQIALEESQKVTVPNVVGKTYKEAKEELEKLELKVDAKLGNSEDDDIVTTQDPSAEERIKKGETVTVYLKTPVTAKSDNFYGMRFRKTIEEFCTDYNKKLKSIFELYETDTKVIDSLMKLESIELSDFSYNGLNANDNLMHYTVRKLNYNIDLFTENDTEYIVYASAYFTSQDRLKYVLTKIAPAIGSALTNLSYQSMISNLEKCGSKSYFESNVAYSLVQNQTQNQMVYYIYISAMTKDKHTEFENSIKPSADTSTTSENYYEHPQEWYEEQERLYADNTPSTTKPSSSSSQSSSNKGTSTSSSNNSNKTESEYFKVTANINMKQLIQNNLTAKSVVDNVKEFPIIHLSISDGAGDTGLIYEPLNRIDYSEGRQSIPDTITRNISTKAGEKVKFIVKMRSSSEESSSNSVDITLLEKEMTFDKAGTYEIK